jgi:hypothetical protein
MTLQSLLLFATEFACQDNDVREPFRVGYLTRSRALPYLSPFQFNAQGIYAALKELLDGGHSFYTRQCYLAVRSHLSLVHVPALQLTCIPLLWLR